ncbi:hypothetical protein ACMFMG_010945 [Clarireedia jacksonii]
MSFLAPCSRSLPAKDRTLTLSTLQRCTRSCFQCPICISPLTVSAFESSDPSSSTSGSTPYILHCSYCMWSSREIGIQFDKPNSVFSQLAKIKNGGEPVISPRERRRDREERRSSLATTTILEDAEELTEKAQLDPFEKLDAESQFANLKSFYQGQLADSNPSSALGFSSDYGYGSPGALTRIMGLYTGGSLSDKKAKSKGGNIREANDASDGLQIFDPSTETAALTQLHTEGWSGTISPSQRLNQPTPPTRFLSSLRPIPYLLRTKRSKRCRTCRHILTKPESKVQTTRFRIRLIALSYIPSISLSPLPPNPSIVLLPLRPTQFLLTFKNPLFDPIKVSLATKVRTTDRHASKVILLCPQFDVGANTDMWDEALQDGSTGAGGKDSSQRERRATVSSELGAEGGEAHGKPWDKGRNWTSVVVEVTPGRWSSTGAGAGHGTGTEKETVERLDEDEDLCEIPVFVRVEWETDAGGDEPGMGGSGGPGGGAIGREKEKEKEGREKRELAYWCVLGVGRIAM